MATRARRGRILKVEIDPSSSEPLYRQIYGSIRRDILARLLAPGARLPSTRRLAGDLGVARSTIVIAYEQLRAEGYIEGTMGAGTHVSGTLPDSFVQTRPAGTVRALAPSTGRISARGQAILATKCRGLWPSGHGPRAFRAGVPAVDVFPVDTWGRLMARRWNRTSSRVLSYGDAFGFLPLRTAVADYLRAARGVRCTPEQVMIVAGSQQALDLSARVLLDPGDEAWLEDPGYHGARGAFAVAGASVVGVPVDEHGLDPERGRALAPHARLAFVTPSRQLPLGVTMTLARRLELLRWADEADAWVLEDDYDSEFRYASRPLAALQGLDERSRVLYAGTFSKVMFPALRLGYLVVPERLIEAFAVTRHFADYHSPYLEQAIMADFIADGHFERHIRRMRAIYQERQAVLVECAARELAGRMTVPPADAGMTLIGWLPPGDDDIAVSRTVCSAGVDVLPLSPFAVSRRINPGLLLGYSGVREDEIREGVTALAAVLDGKRSPTAMPHARAPRYAIA